MEKEGGIGVIEVATEVAISKMPADQSKLEPYSKQIDDITRTRYASDLKNISAAYRMMRSLEKRGMVAKVLGTRGWWVPVKMEKDNPKFGVRVLLPERLNKKLDKGASLSFRTGDSIRTI